MPLAALFAGRVTIANLGAQSSTSLGAHSSLGRTIDQLSRVFERLDDEEHSSSDADRRIQWLTLYLLYADDVLSRYAPDGAAGARFALFQFARFSDARPFGYSMHINVTQRHTILMGIVHNAEDKHLDGVRTREARRWSTWTTHSWLPTDEELDRNAQVEVV